MQERWVQSLGQEDPMEEGMATLSRVLAWRIPWTEMGKENFFYKDTETIEIPLIRENIHYFVS